MELIKNYNEAKKYYMQWLKAIRVKTDGIKYPHEEYIESIDYTIYQWEKEQKNRSDFKSSFYNKKDDSNIVQFNLSCSVTSPHVATRFARDNDDIWLIKKASLSGNDMSRTIKVSEFLEYYSLEPIKLNNSNLESFVKVSKLNIPNEEIAKNTADFINKCQKIRLHYGTKANSPSNNEGNKPTEHKNHGPEKTKKSGHKQPPQENISKHTAISKALKKYVNNQGGKHKMYQQSGWESDGADIKNKISYEIKTSHSSTAIQTAVGQLFLYENIISVLSGYRKVIVLPSKPEPFLINALKNIGIEVLIATKSNGGYKFTFLED